ncbi:metallophosphoesterase [Paraburkholderia xenovorans]|uniref:metallophosphoesterase n=1 Tax=Paraburkholderia xenovorans TaxID=36873 RepID=UPI0038B6BB26
MTSYRDILTGITRIADDNNLAGVIVHMNDTYLIESREPRLPGMARVAGMIREIRSLVRDRTGQDLMLVTHGGDYLGPSRIGKRFKGSAMNDLLMHCTTEVATIGNHEFEYGWKVLKQRLTEARRKSHGNGYDVVMSNLLTSDPAGQKLFSPMMLWPRADTRPYVAVFGFAGEQTVKAAQAGSFAPSHPTLESWCDWVAEKVRARRTVRVIAILSHCSREEDRVLQRALHARLPMYQSYVLGGHDHHVGWSEPYGLSSTILKGKAILSVRRCGHSAQGRDSRQRNRRHRVGANGRTQHRGGNAPCAHRNVATRLYG